VAAGTLGSHCPARKFHFAVPAAEPGHAFVKVRGRDLDRIFSIQQERTVNRDNTVSLDNRVLQIEKSRWRGTLAGCRVTIWEHLDGRVTIVSPGGELAVSVAESWDLTLTGPASEIARGTLSQDLLRSLPA
jgi:hypothetical protein